MSTRLQVLIPEPFHRRIRKAATRRRMSVGAWVREAMERALTDGPADDALDVEQMLAEIDAGRG